MIVLKMLLARLILNFFILDLDTLVLANSQRGIILRIFIDIRCDMSHMHATLQPLLPDGTPYANF